MNNVVLFLLGLVHVLGITHGGHIFIYPYGHCLNSHLITMEKIIHVLVNGGNQVTMLIPESYDGPYLNSNFSNVEFLTYSPPADTEPVCHFESLDSFMKTSPIHLWQRFQASSLSYCEAILKNKKVMAYLKQTKFDLAIYEHVDYCSRILADFIDIPFIYLVSQGMESVYPRMPAYMPTILSCYTDDMTMFQRLKNTMIYGLQKIFVALHLRKYESLKQKFGINETVSLHNTPDKASVKFVVGHHTIDYPGPMLPSAVLIGNLNDVIPAPPMPKDVKHFLDNSPEGVVYLSFGSMIKSWDARYQQLFYQAFQKLPYRILWKYHGENVSEIEQNDQILTYKWASQTEILGHKNVKLFITHSGLNSALEVAKAGKPVVAIPLFADQFYQAKKLVNRVKIGTELNIKTLTSQILASAVLETIQNEEYKNNARYVSNLMKESPMTDKQLILYWSDFVMRHGGAPHLKSKVQTMAWYEIVLLDCFAVFLSFLVVIWTCIRWFIKHKNPRCTSISLMKTDENHNYLVALHRDVQ